MQVVLLVSPDTVTASTRSSSHGSIRVEIVTPTNRCLRGRCWGRAVAAEMTPFVREQAFPHRQRFGGYVEQRGHDDMVAESSLGVAVRG